MKTLALTLITVILSIHQANAAEDILSVDKTVVIQMVIFLASIFILNSLLFKPLLGLVDKREQLTTGTIEEAKKLEEKVGQIIEEYNSKLNEARARALEERNETRRQAQVLHEEMIKKAREEAQALLEEAKHKLELETSEIKGKIRSDVETIARDMASRILGKEV
ncbi:MAG TPA: ATP synthase F0 subunit B [Thermodesulfobacteriota bacterium]|nr:ATP synthase F0 subunit B [Thermodesulfobacteriota bacterium]